MRLFVAVLPPEDVLDRIAQVAAALRKGDWDSRSSRGDTPRLRWTTRAQWHITLRFLGKVADPGEVYEALDGMDAELASIPSVEAELGLEVKVLGGSVLCLPVAGLDELAQAVTNGTAGIGQPPDSRPFRGHVTLARLRGRQRRGQRIDAQKAARLLETSQPQSGRQIAAHWPVDQVHVVRSHTHPDGSRYETLSTKTLAPTTNRP